MLGTVSLGCVLLLEEVVAKGTQGKKRKYCNVHILAKADKTVLFINVLIQASESQFSKCKK